MKNLRSLQVTISNVDRQTYAIKTTIAEPVSFKSTVQLSKNIVDPKSGTL